MAVPLNLPGLIDGAIARAMRQVDRVLTRAVATGQDARDVAARIGRFLSPRFSPRRDVAGRVVRANLPGALADWPAASGMGSAGVRLIAEHEINAAASTRIITIAQRTPGYALRWLLSPAHSVSDQCTGYATADNGLGAGVYLPHDMPPLPAHIRCACSAHMVALP